MVIIVIINSDDYTNSGYNTNSSDYINGYMMGL